MESLLYAVTKRYAFVFPVAKLLGLGKNKIQNWDSLPVLPASIFSHLKFPIQNARDFHDSTNAFLLGGGGESWELHCHNGNLHISEYHDFIPPPPTTSSPSDHFFVANIRGKIYLFAHVRGEGFWVLESGNWRSLPYPPLSPISPTFRDYYDSDCPWCHWFISNDKLFILAYYLPRKEEIVVYDPQSNVWEKVEDKDTYSRLRAIDFDSITTISVPGVSNNCSVALTFKKDNSGEDLVKFNLYALLLDKETNLVRRRQLLDECSNEIQVTRVCPRYTNMRFVDLGNGMVCALIFGRAQTKEVQGSQVFSTAEQVTHGIDATGLTLTASVTGATSGIGYAVSMLLLGIRNTAAGGKVKDAILIDVMELDLSSMESVRKFADFDIGGGKLNAILIDIKGLTNAGKWKH
ncbi:hypothetical protein PIB30_100049 [Stylosanthes scabra]|uniref:Uncharacterized protein n=1 Tax=Stylosanthes scabra TaxID=79078 RepID=A0ABU6VYA1_9FABA|nr:hypothetical protein [Stylosanthes scabra]